MLIDYNIDGMRNPYDENWKKGAGGLFDPRWNDRRPGIIRDKTKGGIRYRMPPLTNSARVGCQPTQNRGADDIIKMLQFIKPDTGAERL